ncbi:hypothetical protein [Streptomyces sp. TLI_171]|uniref:hypothetical protein n=1 Tax=Streptomyces sp. TLI_171 TaxID=1938859 RepID=UPI0015D54C39|nr:hypothetical protein [Streptomyces sp. TLI_171]
MAIDYRRADVLLLECPFTGTTVSAVSRFHVSVRWPWSEVDPPATGFRWNGDRALPTPEAREWELFRTEPPETALRTGDHCRVGVPTTVVHVAGVVHFDPPQVTGLLPRPACYLDLLPQGAAYDSDLEDQAYALDPAGAEPIRIQLLFRPYAFLEPGDELVDCGGRAWRFDAAWEWHPLDDGEEGVPAWPLVLTSRGGEPSAEEAATVAGATAVGSHAAEANRWAGLTLAEPVADSR